MVIGLTGDTSMGNCKPVTGSTIKSQNSDNDHDGYLFQSEEHTDRSGGSAPSASIN